MKIIYKVGRVGQLGHMYNRLYGVVYLFCYINNCNISIIAIDDEYLTQIGS